MAQVVPRSRGKEIVLMMEKGLIWHEWFLGAGGKRIVLMMEKGLRWHEWFLGAGERRLY